MELRVTHGGYDGQRVLVDSTADFLCPDFGRPRSLHIGTIASSRAFVNGFASGSALADFTIFLLSSIEGIAITRLVEVFDIVFDLLSLGEPQADCSSDFAPVDECHVVESAQVPARRRQ